MSTDDISLILALLAVLVLSVCLGYAITSRFARRPWPLYFALWSVAFLSRAAVQMWSPRIEAGTLLAVIPILSICTSEGLRLARERLHAARSLGASDWRIFWRVLLPEAWPWIAGGILLATLAPL